VGHKNIKLLTASCCRT